MPIESNRRHFGWIKKSFAVELIKGFFFQFSAFFVLMMAGDKNFSFAEFSSLEVHLLLRYREPESVFQEDFGKPGLHKGNPVRFSVILGTDRQSVPEPPASHSVGGIGDFSKHLFGRHTRQEAGPPGSLRCKPSVRTPRRP